MLHKIVTSCLRPKAASKTDVSKYEAILMYAIKRGKPFSLPHSILLHMYQIITSEKGQLPHASLITRIFQHLQITIPTTLQKTIVPLMQINRASLSKMRLSDVTSALRELPKESVSKSVSRGKRKMEDLGSALKKRMKIIKLKDEDSSSDKTETTGDEEREEDKEDKEEEEEEAKVDEVDRDDEKEPEFFPSSQITPEHDTGDYQTLNSGGETQDVGGEDIQTGDSLKFAPVCTAEIEEEDTTGTDSEKLIRHQKKPRADDGADSVQMKTGQIATDIPEKSFPRHSDTSIVPVEVPASHQTQDTPFVPSNLQMFDILQQVLAKQNEIHKEQARQAHVLNEIQAMLLQSASSGADQINILRAVEEKQNQTHILLNQCIAKTEETSLDLENLRIVKGSHMA